jgi:ATP synthase protein I
MSGSDDSREEALKRLGESADALEARTARPAGGTHGQAVNQAYRILAELLGGVLVGLALGYGVDRFAGTSPVGVISGVLFGFALSIYMARRTANRVMAQAKAEQTEPVRSIPFDDEED